MLTLQTVVRRVALIVWNGQSFDRCNFNQYQALNKTANSTYFRNHSGQLCYLLLYLVKIGDHLLLFLFCFRARQTLWLSQWLAVLKWVMHYIYTWPQLDEMLQWKDGETVQRTSDSPLSVRSNSVECLFPVISLIPTSQTVSNKWCSVRLDFYLYIKGLPYQYQLPV